MSTHAGAERQSTEPVRRTIRPSWRMSIAAVALGLVALLGTACQPASPAHDAVNRYFPEPELTPCAGRIVTRESNWQADAVSPGGGNIGLFQINKVHASWIKAEFGYSFTDLKDPYKNARVARRIKDKAYAAYRDGWQPWRLDGKARPGGGCPA